MPSSQWETFPCALRGCREEGTRFKETADAELFPARGQGSTSLTMCGLRSTFPARGEGAPARRRGSFVRPFDIGRSLSRVLPARGERCTKAFTFRIVGQGAPGAEELRPAFPQTGRGRRAADARPWQKQPFPPREDGRSTPDGEASPGLRDSISWKTPSNIWNFSQKRTGRTRRTGRPRPVSPLAGARPDAAKSAPSGRNRPPLP